MRHTPRLLPLLIALLLVSILPAQSPAPEQKGAFDPAEFTPATPDERALLQQISLLVAGVTPPGPVKPVAQLKLDALKRYLQDFPTGKFHMPAAMLISRSLQEQDRVPELLVLAKERLAGEPTAAHAEAAVMMLRAHAKLTKDPAPAMAALDDLTRSRSAQIAWLGVMGGAQVLNSAGKAKDAQTRLEKIPDKDLTETQLLERDFGIANLLKEQSAEAGADERTKLEDRAIVLLQKIVAASEKDAASHAEFSDALLTLAHIGLSRADGKLALEAYQKAAKLFPGTNAATEAEMMSGQVELLGKPAPAFEGPGLDGKPWSSKALAGKVALVDFWATTCPPCVAEAPNVAKLAHDLAKRPFAIVSVSLDLPKREASITRFLTQIGIDWPQVYEGKGWKSAIAGQWKVTSIPSMFLLDETGTVKRVGLRGEELRPAVEAELSRFEKSQKK